MTETQKAKGWDKVSDAELTNVDRVTAAKIAADMDLTTVESVSYDGETDKYKVELTAEGGVTAFGRADSRFAIKSVLASGEPETITLYVVEKRV